MDKSKKSKICAFDIETIIDISCIPLLPEVKPDARTKPDSPKYEEKLLKKQEAQLDKMSVNPHQNLICSASWWGGDGKKGYIILEDGEYPEKNEKKLILDFWDILKDYEYFISFNGSSFDIPTMTLHSMRHKIRPSVEISTDKYNSHKRNHLDCYNILSDFGKRKGGLDYYLKYFDICDGKGDIDGSMVQKMWDDGEYEKIGKYCLEDSRKTFDLGILIMDYYL